MNCNDGAGRIIYTIQRAESRGYVIVIDELYYSTMNAEVY